MADIPLRRWETMDYKANGWSLEHVHARDERFVCAVTCRQCGKTETASIEIDLGMTEPADDFSRPPHVGVLAVDYRRAELSVMRYVNKVRRAFGVEYISVNMNKHEALTPHNGAKLTWMSADDIDAGVGFTFSKLIIDEGQAVSDKVIEKIWPALDVRNAQIRAFGTPDITPDQTWFRGLFKLGEDGEHDHYAYTLSCYDNPWMSLEAIDRAKQQLPDREFKMLYLGQWVDDEGSVFKVVEPAMLDTTPDYDPDKRMIMAIDLAIRDDFTVVMVGEENTRRAIDMQRWNLTDPGTTYDRIQGLWMKYGRPPVVADESGMGGIAMIHELRERGLKVRGIRFSPNDRSAMIARLQGDLEHGRIRFSREWAVLLNELKAFVYKETPGGKITAAPTAGYHDDCVFALIMLNEGMRHNGGTAEQYDWAEKRGGFRSAMSRNRTVEY